MEATEGIQENITIMFPHERMGKAELLKLFSVGTNGHCKSFDL